MKYTKYPELKADLKELAKEIKKQKWLRDRWHDTDKQQWVFQLKVVQLAYEFRHKHIAYCMLRGRKYEEIENYCHEAPDFDRIDRIKLEHGQKTLRACA